MIHKYGVDIIIYSSSNFMLNSLGISIFFFKDYYNNDVRKQIPNFVPFHTTIFRLHFSKNIFFLT